MAPGLNKGRILICCICLVFLFNFTIITSHPLSAQIQYNHVVHHNASGNVECQHIQNVRVCLLSLNKKKKEKRYALPINIIA